MARLASTSPNFADCLTVGEAASYLGVSTATLRNWDRSGKLKPRRHPQNGYRIYLHEDLEAVLRSADLATLSDDALAPHVDWSNMRDGEHFVQFYETDEYLIDSVSAYVGTALRNGDSSVVIVTADHRAALEQKLIASSVQVKEAENEGRYAVLDASECLSSFMVGSSPDPRRFEATVGMVIARLAERGRPIRAFGEMVALLWTDGKREAAIELEQLWSNLAARYRFALFCAYPIAAFGDDDAAVNFEGVCSCHSRVIPAESYTAAETLDDRLRAIARLQQQAYAVQAETEFRPGVH